MPPVASAWQVSPGGLHQGRFDTTGMGNDDACRAYLERLDGILETTFLEPFQAVLDAYRLGAFSVLVLEASARRTTRTTQRIAQDRYDSIGVQYIVSGTASGDADGRPVTSLPGTVMILDYGRPFTITDHGARDVVNIALPRGSFPTKDVAAWHGAVLRGAAAQVLARFVAMLVEMLPILPEMAGDAIGQAFVALLQAALGEEPAAPMSEPNARLIARAERTVDDRLALPDLDPAWLAGRLGVSRSELYSVMERFGGVARFILYRRLTAARRALEDPADDRRIGEIAFAHGFSTEAHFARSFRTAFGMTATVARQQARASSVDMGTDVQGRDKGLKKHDEIARSDKESGRTDKRVRNVLS